MQRATLRGNIYRALLFLCLTSWVCADSASLEESLLNEYHASLETPVVRQFETLAETDDPWSLFEDPIVVDFDTVPIDTRLSPSHSNPFDLLVCTGQVMAFSFGELSGHHLGADPNQSDPNRRAVRLDLVDLPVLRVGAFIWSECGSPAVMTVYDENDLEITSYTVSDCKRTPFITLETTEDRPIRSVEWRSQDGASLNTFPRVDNIMMDLLIPSFTCPELPAPTLSVDPNLQEPNSLTVSWTPLGLPREYAATGLPLPIQDNETTWFELNIEDKGAIGNLNVKLNIDHGWDSDLEAFLVSPDDVRVTLFKGVGSSKDDFIDTVFDDDADQSINEGTAPFTGTFRPESPLSALFGTELGGTWLLEIRDTAEYISGSLEAWSLLTNKGGVMYQMQYTTDPCFVDNVTDSNLLPEPWMTFTDLDPNHPTWFRVKALPLSTWTQSGQAGFVTGTLSDVLATQEGVVTLTGGEDGTPIDIIENPSYEDRSGWTDVESDPNGIACFRSSGWSTDGEYAMCTAFWSDPHATGDYGAFVQTVDWTGVDSLVFDVQTKYARHVILKLFLDDEVVWSFEPLGESEELQTVRVDVSAFVGEHRLEVRAETKAENSSYASVYWDHFRTSIAGSGASSGTLVSPPIELAGRGVWQTLEFDVNMPDHTALTIDVLPETGDHPIPGYADVNSPILLEDIVDKIIRLRANLSTEEPEITPELHAWSVSWINMACQSDWSGPLSVDPASDPNVSGL